VDVPHPQKPHENSVVKLRDDGSLLTVAPS